MKEKSFKKLSVHFSRPDAALLESLLESEGIRYYLSGRYNHLTDVTTLANLVFQVDSEDYERAKGIVEDMKTYEPDEAQLESAALAAWDEDAKGPMDE